MYKHLIFYDGSCGLCDFLVQWLYRKDTDKIFAFAPLQGQTAKRFLQEQPVDLDTMILVDEEKKVYLMGKAALRTLWLLGGWWKLLGWMMILPAWFLNPFYKLVAKNRYRLFGTKECLLPPSDAKDRFLP